MTRQRRQQLNSRSGVSENSHRLVGGRALERLVAVDASRLANEYRDRSLSPVWRRRPTARQQVATTSPMTSSFVLPQSNCQPDSIFVSTDLMTQSWPANPNLPHSSSTLCELERRQSDANKDNEPLRNACMPAPRLPLTAGNSQRCSAVVSSSCQQQQTADGRTPLVRRFSERRFDSDRSDECEWKPRPDFRKRQSLVEALHNSKPPFENSPSLSVFQPQETVSQEPTTSNFVIRTTPNKTAFEQPKRPLSVNVCKRDKSDVNFTVASDHNHRQSLLIGGRKGFLKKLLQSTTQMINGEQRLTPLVTEPLICHDQRVVSTDGYDGRKSTGITGSSLPGTPIRRRMAIEAETSHVIVERIYCVRQVLEKISEEYRLYNGPTDDGRFRLDPPRPARFTPPHHSVAARVRCNRPPFLPPPPPTHHASSSNGRHHNGVVVDELDLPPRLMRPKTGRRGSMRRSKSQPMHNQELETRQSTEINGNIQIDIPSQQNHLHPPVQFYTSADTPVDGTTPVTMHTADVVVAGSSSSNVSTATGDGNSLAQPAQLSSSGYRSSVHSSSSEATTSGGEDSLDSKAMRVGGHNRSTTTEDGGVVGGGVAVMMVEALWDHQSMQPDELLFANGDVIRVTDWSHPEIWFGSTLNGQTNGWFPASYVRPLTDQTYYLDGSARNSVGSDDTSTGGGDSRQRKLRSNIVQELISTERDYVQLLEHLVQGFLHQAEKRPELFPADRVTSIFCNLEQIYELHLAFLRDLELAFCEGDPQASCVGNCFLLHQPRFDIYSDYCNNRPNSCAELALINKKSSYYQFFEACRLLRGLPKLGLEGFLLTPVQRICKYPLQLAELSKATPESHPDYEHCQKALSSMRRVAQVINERKRRLECLQTISHWQKSIEGWKGPNLLTSNTILIHQGEVTCRCLIGENLQWTKDVTAFMFDDTLVLCKKDILKRGSFIFKDRISLQHFSFIPLTDGKDMAFGVSVKHAWKLMDESGVQYLFMSRDRKSKRLWEECFDRRRNYLNDHEHAALPELQALSSPRPPVGNRKMSESSLQTNTTKMDVSRKRSESTKFLRIGRRK